MPSLCQCSQNGLITEPVRVNGIRLGGIGFFGDTSTLDASGKPMLVDQSVQKPEDMGSGGGMWGKLLSMVGGSKGDGSNIFASSLMTGNVQDAQDAARRRNMALLAVGVGIAGFAGLVYLVGRK